MDVGPDPAAEDSNQGHSFSKVSRSSAPVSFNTEAIWHDGIVWMSARGARINGRLSTMTGQSKYTQSA